MHSYFKIQIEGDFLNEDNSLKHQLDDAYCFVLISDNKIVDATVILEYGVYQHLDASFSHLFGVKKEGELVKMTSYKSVWTNRELRVIFDKKDNDPIRNLTAGLWHKLNCKPELTIYNG